MEAVIVVGLFFFIVFCIIMAVYTKNNKKHGTAKDTSNVESTVQHEGFQIQILVKVSAYLILIGSLLSFFYYVSEKNFELAILSIISGSITFVLFLTIAKVADNTDEIKKRLNER